MEVDSRYLESTEAGNEGYGLWGAAANLYGYSTLDMLAQFQSTGRMYVPWSGFIGGGKQGFGANMTGRKFGGVTQGLFGLKGIGKSGKMLMGASRAAGATNAYFVATDPLWFTARFLGNPLMLAAGAAWFMGGATLTNAARGIEKNQYIRMNIPFEDTEQSYTSRQRAVRAIAESHLQARSAIGNEAQLFHR